MAAFELDRREAASVQAASIHHVLDGVAGYFASEAAAQAMLVALHDRHGLEPAQLELLAPADASWLRFIRRARQWNRSPAPQGQSAPVAVWLSAAVGAVVAVAVVASVGPNWGADQAPMTPLAVVVAIVLAALAGALAVGGASACLLRQQPQYRSFDRVIRRKLADGQWVVLAHDLPWAQQAPVVALISRFSLNWSAVSSAQGRL
jgi:hypothetical protein